MFLNSDNNIREIINSAHTTTSVTVPNVATER